MAENCRDAQEPADALAEIDARRRQAVALSDPLPAWYVLASMLYVASMSAFRDFPASRLTMPLAFAIAAMLPAVALLRWRLRRATLHSSLRRLGWWIPCLAAVIALAAAILLPPYVAGLGVRHPATVTGVVLACVFGPLLVLTDRLRRRYVIKRMVRR
jgi:hypothetical protein